MTANRHALLIDFGSTYTKLRAVDLDDPRIVGAGQGPSTVDSDITVGLVRALDDLEAKLGILPAFSYRLASSSAAGGLRMVTVGLVRELTAEAARQAALGAGARLVGSFAYKLTSGDLEEIAVLDPDILLLVGGTDGGNEETVLHNGAMLARESLSCPVVFAGNRNALDGVRAEFEQAGKNIVAADNVMPNFGELNIEPARAAIRRVFIDRIVHAKGIDRAANMFDRVLMPTPAAVLEGARLLGDGGHGRAGLGSLMVVDVGGATTDVHSIATGMPQDEGAVYQGLPPPYAMRTVEGDLGMRHNINSIIEETGVEIFAADSGLDRDRVAVLTELFSKNVGRLPETSDERAFDHALARAAVGLSVRRHAGTVETAYTPMGPVIVQHGKDLRNVTALIGTGGALVHGENSDSILAAALADKSDPMSLRPRAPKLFLDKDYILYACGLLSMVEPDVALDFGLANLHPLTQETRDGRTSVA
ncbi:MAG: methylaspartate mutase accessory protein GlmL [Rhodospirillales bacterium]|nr:methylaspartate mutase accessory protein GlmL [Rhodospirillales bacterium]